MKHRSPFAVILLSIITLGIYSIVWEVKTKIEMNKLGAQIPTAWLIIIPIVNIWWLWKYSQGVDEVTNGKMSTVIAFILLFVLGFIGMAIIQNDFNAISTTPAEASPEAAAPLVADSGLQPAASAPTPPTVAAPETPAPTPPTTPTPPVV